MKILLKIKIRQLLISVLIAGLSAFTVNAQRGYEIKVKITPLHDTTIVLGHHFGTSIYPDDTARLDKNGKGVFSKRNKTLTGGMYIIYLPNKAYFDFLINDKQNFSIENDTSDLFKKAKFSNSPDNDIFFDYQYFLSDKRDSLKELQNKKKNAKTDSEKEDITKQMQAVDKEVASRIAKIISDHPTTLAAKFIKATRDVEIPDPPKDENGKIKDSLFQYRYYRSHYFDNLDLSDPRMLRMPPVIYENKILNYIDKVIPQIPDSINPELDKLIAKSRTSDELFRFMLVTLFNHYTKSQIMGFDAVQVYLAEKYYVPEAKWSDTAYMTKLKDFVKRTKPLLLGKVAPDIQLVRVPTEHFIEAADSIPMKKDPYVGSFFNLHEIQSKFTILYFWDADCGHCKKATPVMYDVAQKLKSKDVEVIAISLQFGQEGKVKWINYINENKYYDWINAWNPYDYKFKELYDVSSTPQIFILDKDKKIIAKRIGPEQVTEIIDVFLNRDSKK